jgi:hypothetical protein
MRTSKLQSAPEGSFQFHLLMPAPASQLFPNDLD